MPLSVPFLFSGSVHLGLFLLLFFSVEKNFSETVEISLIETEPAQTVSLKPNTSAPPVKVVKEKAKEVSPALSKSQETISTNEELSESSSEASGAQVVSAEEYYKSQIARVLNSRKTYPSLAKRLKHQGRVVVQFNVSREGRILEARVVKASPFKTLNESAKDLIEGIKDLNPFPEEIKKTTWLFQVPVDYQM